MGINERIGLNIRSVRKMRGYTASQLGELVGSASGVPLSGAAILHYERGERNVTVEDLVLLSVALECSMQTLLDGLDPRMGIIELPDKPMSVLSPQDHRIMRYLATDWRGDIHALIVAMGVYGCLPEQYAKDAMLGLMVQMTKALQDGRISEHDLPDGIPYLEQKIGGLK